MDSREFTPDPIGAGMTRVDGSRPPGFSLFWRRNLGRSSWLAQRSPNDRRRRPHAASLLDTAQRAPGSCLAVVLLLHVAIWTALPALLSHNLQLDLVEDLALGREWQLGYWKHPPLPWWLADLAYRLEGAANTGYVTGPLSAVTSFLRVLQLPSAKKWMISEYICLVFYKRNHF